MATATAATVDAPGPGEEWLPVAAVARMFNLCVPAAVRVLKRAGIPARVYPGMKPRYHRSDVERIIREATRTP